MTTRLLLVDGDAWNHRLIMSALRHKDYQIETATDGCTALARAMHRPPHLVISDVLVPQMSGWRLLRRLRAQKELAGTPFMVLTGLSSPETRRHSFRLGADDHLIKPFDPRDLAVRVHNAVRRSQLPRGPADRPVVYGRGLSGALEDISLPSLLVLLEMERRHGLLVITNVHTGERCRVFLRDGRVVSAVHDASPALRDAELIYRVLGWSKGAFEFKALTVEMGDEVQTSTTHLLLEGSRRLDEHHREAGPLVVDTRHTSDRHSLHISFSDRLTNILGPDRRPKD